MAHSVILMNNCLNSMKGNATTGGLVDLQTMYTAVDANLPFLDKPAVDEAHELLESVQVFLCDGGTFEGAGDQVQIFITDLTPYQ